MAEFSRWIRIDAILCKISEPMATGRSQRMFRIQADEEEKIERLFVPNHKKMKCPLLLTEIAQTIRLNIGKKEC